MADSEDRDSRQDGDDRRAYRRVELWFPVTLAFDEEVVLGLCQDVSAGGILVAAMSVVPVGAKTVARFRTSPELRDERTISGTIVRQEMTTGKLMLAFPFLVAVQFDETVEDLVDEVAAQSQRFG